MKKFLLAIELVFFTQLLKAQLKTSKPICPTFSIDVLEGILNNAVTTKSTLGQVKNFFPCFTEIVEEPSATKCGGIFYARGCSRKSPAIKTMRLPDSATDELGQLLARPTQG